MILGAVWMLAGIVFAVGLVHLLQAAFHLFSKGRPLHVVMITRNNGPQIEWYIRTLFFCHWLKGSRVKLTIVDEGSKDETLRIIRKLTEDRNVEIQVSSFGADDCEEMASIAALCEERVVTVHMNRQEELAKWPLLQELQ